MSFDIFRLLFKGARNVPYLMRKVLEEESSYQGAVKRLIDTDLLAPVYWIVAGKQHNEGIIIEHDIKGVHAA